MLIGGERRLEAAELARRAGRAASALTALGIGEGDSVATLLRNDFPNFELLNAAGQIGALVVPINWHSAGPDVGYILEDSGARVLVAHADLYRPLAGAVPPGVRVFLVETPAEIAAAYGVSPDEAALPPGAESWEAFRDAHEARDLPSSAQPGGSMMYTSGTTGRPKGVRRIVRSDQERAGLTEMLSTVFGFDDRPMRVALTGPMYHSAPGAHAVMALAFGADIVLQPKFEAEDLLALVERHRITHLHMVPIMFIRLLKLAEAVRRKYDLSSLRFVTHGAAPCPREAKLAMIDWWGPIIGEYYGSTETGAVTFCSADEYVARPGTVGRALKGSTVKVLDETGMEVPRGREGEVFARNAMVSDFTYHGDADKRAACDRDGLITAGDIGFMDDDGFLYLSDRKKDMIISGGVNIYPAQVEAALAGCPGVRDCAVFGIPDDEFGESVCAVIQPEAGAEITAQAVQSYLKGRIAGYTIPRRIEFRDDLPREATGKIFKRRLRDEYWRALGRAI
ncbi:MAG: AMP-binding protein [Alphaproteobacteria bacterium]|nr:AMP-binding protein [Alphaproteobacteria bacterium]